MISDETLRIEYTTRFKRQLNQASLEIKTAFKEARELFYDNQDHSSLRNHALRGKFAGFRSIDVTEDYRALFKIRKTKTQTIITFYLLGTHKELYKKPAQN